MILPKVKQPLTEEYYKLLDEGVTAPRIEGKLFPDYSQNVVIDTDKLTFLDFWYTSCQPCIEAIPHLNCLKKKYHEQKQIIGVNDIDNNPNDKKKINAFLNRTPIDYKILLVDSIPKEFNIRVYPSLYLIGKDNKVKYSLMSYTEDLFEKLDKVVEKILNE